MIQISKNEFLDMFQLNILNEKDKDWVVTSQKKPSRRKKHYISNGRYEQYLRIKNK